MITRRAKAKWEIDFDKTYFSRYRDISDAWIPVDARTPEQCDEANKNLKKELIDLFPKMEFIAEYEVRVINECDTEGE